MEYYSNESFNLVKPFYSHGKTSLKSLIGCDYFETKVSANFHQGVFMEHNLRKLYIANHQVSNAVIIWGMLGEKKK